MTQTTKTITRVLAELKSIDERLATPASFGAVAGISVGQGSSPSVIQGFGGDLPKNHDEAAKKITANLNQIIGLMDRRQQLKAAVILSNATTYVTVGARHMSVAEAIELKTRVSTIDGLLNYVRTQVNVANGRVVQLEREVEVMIASQVNTLLSSAGEKPELSTITSEISRPIYAAKKPNAMVEEATKFVDKYAAELETLRTEIDFVLSESNARTTVVV